MIDEKVTYQAMMGQLVVTLLLGRLAHRDESGMVQTRSVFVSMSVLSMSVSVRGPCRRRAEHGGHRARAGRGDLMLSERAVAQPRRPVRVFVLVRLKLLEAVMLVLVLLLLKLWLLVLLCVVLLRVRVRNGGVMAIAVRLHVVARVLRVQRHGTIPPSADEARDLRRSAAGAHAAAARLRAKAERGARPVHLCVGV